jgi:phenylpropionate dioxygenase-like ring-hydroxylating dioxygenase large terminal subunit
MKAMEPATHQRLLDDLAAGTQDRCAPFAVPAERYRDPAWLAREAPAFRAPQIVAASAALAPGASMPVDLPGVAAIVARAPDGTVRAFANACRHRATRLVDAPCTAKAYVCPYHGWTYALTGTLIHVPHPEAFPGCERRDLRPLPVAERHGLIWLGTGIDDFLAGLGPDLAALDLASCVVWRSSRTVRRCNWNLAVEAVLDGYHIRILHRDSIYRFFHDAASAAEPIGPHVRAVTRRRAETGPLHELGTPSYLIFPSTIVIEHPDFTSVMTLRPTAPDATLVEHAMLVPAARAGETEHWQKSWQLIDETVLQREDFGACEQIQRGLVATDELLFGGLESPIRWFHAELARACASAVPSVL